jgi:hypothetical protein
MPFIGRNIHVLVISPLSWAPREIESRRGRKGGHVDHIRGQRRAATGLTMLGAAWTATAITAVFRGRPGALSMPLAVFLLALAAIMLVLAASSVPGQPLFSGLLLGACPFALIGSSRVTAPVPIERAAGWLQAGQEAGVGWQL